jgi:hypothetical protein
MISKKEIKNLGFETIEELYFYIVDSEIVGAISQAKEMTNRLSNKQYVDFIEYLVECNYESKFIAKFVVWRKEKWK